MRIHAFDIRTKNTLIKQKQFHVTHTYLKKRRGSPGSVGPGVVLLEDLQVRVLLEHGHDVSL